MTFFLPQVNKIKMEILLKYSLTSILMVELFYQKSVQFGQEKTYIFLRKCCQHFRKKTNQMSFHFSTKKCLIFFSINIPITGNSLHAGNFSCLC